MEKQYVCYQCGTPEKSRKSFSSLPQTSKNEERTPNFQQRYAGTEHRRFTTSVVRRSHYEEGPGKNLPFSVENKWWLLVMMTMYFGPGFAAPFFFFIVRHQLLKK
ncbi:cytochrome c oxidase subunit 7C, mitochondrial-like [Puma concolor]|uniref:Cytochrome c oxidase subunit 7C, mitochondrial n=1 Tax=Puma concolor TaxID=9696 RepID=A0A6P6IJY5_PUMCO|nr:cytochrome c oxidase subunit 7C, mitochondrial-like [Puma concolor]